MSFRFLVLGDVIDDIVVRPESEIRPDTDTDAVIELRAGGSGANVAAWLGYLGAAVEFVGTVAVGDVARHSAELIVHGVRASLSASDEPTGTIVVIARGDSRSMLTSRGANRTTGPALLTDEMLAAADHLHISGYSIFSGGPIRTLAGWAALIARAHAAGLTVSVDPSSSGYLQDYGVDAFLGAIDGTDILLPNLDEGRVLSGRHEPMEVASALANRFPLVVLTLGRDGAIVADARGVQEVSTVPRIDAVDATGAGDAFSAGFLAARSLGASSIDAATAGHRAAAVAVMAAGGRPAHAL
ncbi:carbohydrate kinase family protein [Naasia lichenicola]|uniref:carbohydrate kinase family protein n=1 Tax=Naasia lichenicola TaxID=2565933 RepID=UPI00130EA48C|nr:PfkB family carbohydrate kinase [Naasia lichenicola]